MHIFCVYMCLSLLGNTSHGADINRKISKFNKKKIQSKISEKGLGKFLCPLWTYFAERSKHRHTYIHYSLQKHHKEYGDGDMFFLRVH